MDLIVTISLRSVTQLSPRSTLMSDASWHCLYSVYPRLLFDAGISHKNMNTRIFITIAALFLTTAGLKAQFSVDSVVANAAGDPENAGAIVANAVVKHPKLLARIVTACVSALPKQAADIVRALLKVDPDHANDILRAAIHAQPRLAVKITDAALQTLPENMDADIIKTAVNAAPDDLKDEVAESTGDNEGDNGGHAGGGNGGTSGPASFPSQPINPDLVSPSS
jgi:hypothetical protein